MPCRGPDDDMFFGGYRLQNKVQAQQKEIDRLTALLCQACRKIHPDKLGPELERWFHQHDAEDRERAERDRQEHILRVKEAERKRYLADVRERLNEQLTDEEKEALGIKKVP